MQKEAKVFFIPVKDGEGRAEIAAKAVKIADAAGLAGAVPKDKPCAVKQHFGEGQNEGHIKPEITRAMVDWVRKAGGRPFVTDTNTLYRGKRANALDHLETARGHGFTQEALGAPIIIADGLLGVEHVAVTIQGGKHFKEVRIAAAGYHAAGAIVLTHMTGHCLGGMGGAIKNVAMGFASRSGKMAQHHQGLPIFSQEKCKACGVCGRWCPAEAIRVEKKALLAAEKCIGCGECMSLCPHGAIGFGWGAKGPILLEKMCEYALGFLSNKKGRVGYLNFLTDVTMNCDCLGRKQEASYPNVGILASDDLIAVETATADLSLQRYGRDIWLTWWPDSSYQTQFEYGEKIGLGTRQYELVEL
jgi:uncharacterized Fe-S center protein